MFYFRIIFLWVRVSVSGPACSFGFCPIRNLYLSIYLLQLGIDIKVMSLCFFIQTNRFSFISHSDYSLNDVYMFLECFRDNKYNRTELTVNDLEVFQSVRQINGYFRVEANHTTLKNLSFFRSLSVVKGNTLFK